MYLLGTPLRRKRRQADEQAQEAKATSADTPPTA
jgi:hypothetical protein